MKDKKVLKEMGEKAHTVAIQDVEEKNLQRNQRSCLKTTPYNLLIKGEFKWQTS